MRGEHRRALYFVRPPGHHALREHAMGFCLLANVALAARVAIDELGLDRVLIVDWDVHHGNGTQDIFWEDSQVAFFSMHRYPFNPGNGAADETGTGKGLARRAEQESTVPVGGHASVVVSPVWQTCMQPLAPAGEANSGRHDQWR